jgi:hypothetical protein
MVASDIVTIISAVTISITTILGTIATLYTTMRVKAIKSSADRMEEQNARLEASAEVQVQELQKIHVATNGMKDEIVAATDKAARAEGRAQGIAEEVGRQTDKR